MISKGVIAMRFKPHTYQEEALKHIVDNNACGLFLDMG